MFKVGDRVRAREDHRNWKKGEIFIVTKLVPHDQEEMIKVSGLEGEFFARRFDLYSAPSLTYNKDRRKGFRIETVVIKGTPKTTRIAAINKIRQYRDMAGRIFKFSPVPGEKINALRLTLADTTITTRFLCNDRYGIRISMSGEPRKSLLVHYREKIKESRKSSKFIYYSPSFTGFCREQRIHLRSGDILGLYHSKVLKIAKSPKTKQKHIGIEVECGWEKGLNWSLFIPLKDKISIVSDGSIRNLPPGYEPHEVRLLTTETDFLQDVKALCLILAQMKAVVNDSCGLHVHLDMREKKREVVLAQFENLVRSQKYLQGLVTAKRRTNTYCKPTRMADPWSQSGRYHAINGTALHKYNTIEIRLHHGSIDELEITNWITLLLRIIDTPEVMKRAPSTLDTFAKKVGIEEPLKNYIKVRIESNTPVVAATVPEDEIAPTPSLSTAF